MMRKWEVDQIQKVIDGFRAAGVSGALIPMCVAHCLAESNPSSTGFKLNNFSSLTWNNQPHGYKSDFELKYNGKGTGIFFAGFKTVADFAITYLSQIRKPRYAIKEGDNPGVFIKKLITGGWINTAHDDPLSYEKNFHAAYDQLKNYFTTNKIS